MISKSMIAAMVLITMGIASGFSSTAFAQAFGPVFVQAPAAYYYGYAYPYGPPGPYAWGPYVGYWNPNNPHSVDNNIHTPPNH